VILSGGAINSPQLLLLSGIGPGAHLQAMGIPVLHDAPEVGATLPITSTSPCRPP
jgi:choline dehydrogenase